jgi:hypothetical protein
MKVRALLVLLAIIAMLPAQGAHAANSLSVWTQSPAYKVQPTTAPGPATTATMEGAQGAYEAYQIIVHAGSTALSGVNVTAGSLSDGNGHTIPMSAITLYLEYMINFTGVSAINGSQPAPAQSPTNDGRVPDPLAPLVDPYTGDPAAAPFTVPANTNQPVWMDVAIPSTAVAGTYSGTVTVSATGQSSVQVPVTLTVWNFTLPNMDSIVAYFKMSINALSDYHGGTYTCTNPADPSTCYLDPNKAKTMTILKRYEELAHDHRIDTGQNFIPDPSNSTCAVPTDWSAYDAAMTPYMNGSHWSDGVPSARLTAPFTPGANWGPEAHCTQAQYEALAGAWATHLMAKGWFNKAIVYALDEPDPSSYPAIIQDSLWMQAGNSAWKSHIMDTTPARASTASELNPALGIYTVALPYYDTWFQQGSDLYGRAQWPGLRAQGIQLWLYTANGDEPPYPAFATNTLLGMEPQMLMWGSWYEGATGFLYWDIADWAASDPWGPNISYGKTGDGVLIYPGNHDGLLSPVGSPAGVAIDGPIPSYRLQMIREGLQDWALFLLAAQHGLTAYARSQVALAYGQLGGCTWQGCAPVNGSYYWKSSATLMAQIRHNIAEAIMSGASTGSPTPTATGAGATGTATVVPPTATATHTPVLPTRTVTPGGPTATASPVSPTETHTPVLPSSTATAATPVRTGTATNTPVRPTETHTPVGATATGTATATSTVPAPTGTATRTGTPIHPTETHTPVATPTKTPIGTPSWPTATATHTPVRPTSTATGAGTSTTVI